MSDITKALQDEEDALLRSIDEDPGPMDQISAAITARSGGLAVILLIVQTVLFLAGAGAAWKFFSAGDVLSALHWGLPAAVLLIMSLMLKLALWPAMTAQRQLQVLKRIELQVRAGRA